MGVGTEPGQTHWVWRPNGRRVVLTAFLIVAGASCALIFLRPAGDQLADLKVYWGAIRHVADGHPLYEFRAANGDPFTYPPFAEWLLSPLGSLPFPVLGVIWTASTLLVLRVLGGLVAGRALSLPTQRRRTAAWLIALGLLISAPGQSDIRFGQVSLFLVLVCLADGLEVLPSRYRGILIGVASAIKLTPLLFVVYLWVVGRRADAFRASAAFGVATLIGFVLMPRDSWTFWTSALFATDRIGDIAALGNQSLNGLLLRAGLPGAVRPVVWLIGVVLVVGCALLRARWLARTGQRGAAIVLVGCATLAASPVSWTHHQFWTVLAGMLLIGGGAGPRRAAGWALVGAMTLNLVDVVGHAHLGDHALFLAANARTIATCVVCVLGLSTLARDPAAASASALTAAPRLRALSALSALALALVLFALIPLPSGQDPSLRMSPAGEAVTRALRDGPRAPPRANPTAPSSPCSPAWNSTTGCRVPMPGPRCRGSWLRA